MDTTLTVGAPGSYQVVVDGRVVAEKKSVWGFPSDDEIVQAVGKALGR